MWENHTRRNRLYKYSEKAVLKTQHISTLQNAFAADHMVSSTYGYPKKFRAQQLIFLKQTTKRQSILSKYFRIIIDKTWKLWTPFPSVKSPGLVLSSMTKFHCPSNHWYLNYQHMNNEYRNLLIHATPRKSKATTNFTS